MNFFKDHNHKRLFQLLLLSVLALFLSLLSNQAVMATAEGYCIGENCIYSWWGTGTTGYLPRWTGAQVFGNSVIYQSGTNIGIGTTSPSYKLDIASGNDPGIRLGPNSSYGANLLLGGWTSTVDTARIAVSNGNLHIDSSDATHHIYLNHYHSGNVYIVPGSAQGKVGIGTVSPAQKLHVAGYARADSGFCIGTSCITAWPQGEVTGSGTANYIPRWTTSSNIGNSVIYQSGSNIGIGTTSPGAILEIKDIYSTLIDGSGLQAGSNIYANTTMHIGTKTNNSLSFYSNNESIVTIRPDGNVWLANTGGNVGIGTTSPAQLLHVVGYARADSGFCIGTSCITAWPQGEVTGSGTANYIPRWTTSSNIGNSAIYQSGSNIGIGTTSPGAKLHVGTTSNADQLQMIGPTSNSNSHYQWDGATYRNPGTHTPEVLIRSDNANTGINSFRPALTLYNSQGNLDANVGLVFAMRETADAGNSCNLAGIMGIKESVGNVGAWSQGGLLFFTKNFGAKVDAMRILNNGNVGIGTSSPAQKLHVAGYARADSGFCIGTSCITAWPQGEVTGSGTANYVPLWTTSSNIGNSAIYQSGSRIGIGTTSPSQLLTVQGTDSDLIKVISSSDVGASISLESTGLNGSTWSIISTANEAWGGGGNLGFINNSFRLYVKADGNVGIGTTSPAQKLHVAGYARADSGFCIGTSCITAWPQGEVTGSGTANYIPRWTTGSNVGNSVIYQSGSNIGIGTTSPGAKLETAGGRTISYPTPGTSKGDIHINSTGINDDSSSITFGSNSGSIVNSAQAGIYIQGSGAYGTKMYFATTNAHATGSQARMMIDSVGNVGIGTISPAQKLHVVGYARADSGFCIGTSCITAWPEGEVTGSGTANYVPLWTTSSNVGNSVIYQSASNVGIGTTSPQAKLAVEGRVHISSGSYFGDHLISDDILVIAGGKSIQSNIGESLAWPFYSRIRLLDSLHGSMEFYSYTSTSGSTDDGGFKFFLNDEQKVTIDRVGRLGIGGDYPPQSTLDVRGRMYLSNSASSDSLNGITSSDVLVMPEGASIQSNVSEDIKSRIIMLDSLNGAMQFHSYMGGGVGGSSWGGYRFYNNDDEVFTIETTDVLTPNLGFVGINNSNPSYVLDVNGSVRADEYYYSSDASLKTGIGYLPGDEMLSKVLKLQGVSFNWKENGQPSIGFIAQDVEKIFPELVKTDQDGIKSIQYGNLIAPLVEAIKEQQKQIEQLRQEVEELKK